MRLIRIILLAFVAMSLLLVAFAPPVYAKQPTTDVNVTISRFVQSSFAATRSKTGVFTPTLPVAVWVDSELLTGNDLEFVTSPEAECVDVTLPNFGTGGDGLSADMVNMREIGKVYSITFRQAVEGTSDTGGYCIDILYISVHILISDDADETTGVGHNACTETSVERGNSGKPPRVVNECSFEQISVTADVDITVVEVV